MKPSVTVQSSSNFSNSLNFLKTQYNFIERVNIVTDDLEFNLNDIISSYSYLRFRSTLDKFFTFEFIKLFKEHDKRFLMIKSIEPFSELTGISVTIDSTGQMHLTLSKSLDQSTGLDASKPLVDSALFDSSTRLLCFDLVELSGQKNRLERIQKNSKAVLSRPEYSCDFVAIITSNTASYVSDKLSKIFGNPVISDESLHPKLTQKPLKNLPWPAKDEFNLMDRLDTLDLFEWMGLTLNPEIEIENRSIDEEEFFKTDTCKFISLEGQLLPPLDDHLSALSTSSTRFLISLKSCRGIPPSVVLNNERLKHFNEKKFDPTACTADQSSLVIFKTPLQYISFRLNIA